MRFLPTDTAAPCFVVAELSNNANGSLMRARRLLDAAKAAGASAAKIQAFTPDELIKLRGDGPAPAPWQNRTMRELYSQAMLPREWFPKLFRHAESIDLPLFSSVFGWHSIALLEDCGNPCYKIAALDARQWWLTDAARATGKDVLISAPETRLERGLHGCDRWLWCPPGYPQVNTRMDDTRFRCRRGCREDNESLKRFDGFSYHGTDPLPCVVAATLGAKILEAHFQLDDEPSALEANISLTASAFKRMVDDVRRVETLLA